MWRVMIVDDHEVFRDGLRGVLESRGDARVVGEAANVREAFALLTTLAFDLVIVDLTMPGMTGIAFISELRRRGLSQRVLVVTMHADAADAADAFAAGANGFALKSDSRAALLSAIEGVMRGERFVTSSMDGGAVDDLACAAPDTGGAMRLLSPREREVADLLIRGYDNHEIAHELCISAKTVDTHRTHVFRKLRVHSLAALVRLGFRRGAHGDVRPAASGERAANVRLHRNR